MHTVKSPLFISTIILLISGLITTQQVSASEHKHDNHHSQQAMMQLNHGEKWPIDASLHKGMNSIKSSMEANISAIHYKNFKSKQYQTLANEIKVHLVYLFENCKLPTDADAQLHILLFKIMQGNKQMQELGDQRSGAIEIIKALQQYPQYFDDSNWQTLKH